MTQSWVLKKTTSELHFKNLDIKPRKAYHNLGRYLGHIRQRIVLFVFLIIKESLKSVI